MRELTEIALAFIGVAILALIIGRANNTATVIKAATGGFNDLLKTVTLQTGMGGAGFGTGM